MLTQHQQIVGPPEEQRNLPHIREKLEKLPNMPTAVFIKVICSNPDGSSGREKSLQQGGTLGKTLLLSKVLEQAVKQWLRATVRV